MIRILGGGGFGSRIKERYAGYFGALDEKQREWWGAAYELGISSESFYKMMLREYQEVVEDKGLQEDYFVLHERQSQLWAFELDAVPAQETLSYPEGPDAVSKGSESGDEEALSEVESSEHSRPGSVVSTPSVDSVSGKGRGHP